VGRFNYGGNNVIAISAVWGSLGVSKRADSESLTPIRSKRFLVTFRLSGIVGELYAIFAIAGMML
jgi:hypothetical protein